MLSWRRTRLGSLLSCFFSGLRFSDLLQALHVFLSHACVAAPSGMTLCYNWLSWHVIIEGHGYWNYVGSLQPFLPYVNHSCLLYASILMSHTRADEHISYHSLHVTLPQLCMTIHIARQVKEVNRTSVQHVCRIQFLSGSLLFRYFACSFPDWTPLAEDVDAIMVFFVTMTVIWAKLHNIYFNELTLNFVYIAFFAKHLLWFILTFESNVSHEWSFCNEML